MTGLLLDVARFFNKKPSSRPTTKSYLIFGQILVLRVS